MVAALVSTALGSPARADDPGLDGQLDLQPDAASVVRGSSVDVDVLANDSGPGGAALVDPQLAIETVPASGTAEVVDTDGPGGDAPFLRYTPALESPAGDLLVGYRVSDGVLTGTASVTISVQNGAPTAADDSAEVRSSSGTTVLLDVLANDSDIDGGVLSVAPASAPAHGAVTLEAGKLRYDPVDDYVGPDSFTYTISDGQGGRAEATVRVSVLDSTTPMTVNPDSVAATAGVPVSVPVLENDLSGGRDPLTLVGVSAPASGGSAVLSPDGRSIVYTAPASFVGSDTFTYSVGDRRGNVATGQVSATVSAPPIARSVAAGWPTALVVGTRTAIPVSVTGFDATGQSAQLERETSHGWTTVASGTLGGGGGEISLDVSTELADLRPGRRGGEVVLQVLVRAPDGELVASAPESLSVRAFVDIAVSGPLTRKDVRYSYRPGCPVLPASLRRLSVNHWDYSGALKRGTLIVRSDVVRDLKEVFTQAFDTGFQIKKMRPTDKYYNRGRRSPMASDKAAMKAGNTSAFNCRPVVGNPTKRSAHSYGVAIDINAFENPYVVTGGFYPRGAGKYLKRRPCRTGMICAGGVIATTMAERGWPWGARWSRPDYQHFSSSGG